MKKKVPVAKQSLRETVPAPPSRHAPTTSGVHELRVGKRSLRDAVLLLARKIEEELGVDVSDVTEMLGVYNEEPTRKPDPIDPEVFERDTVDMARPVPKAGGDE
jgi:hypothetical protein